MQPLESFVARLPPPEELRRRSQAVALLDAILCADWEDRYFSFDSSWSETEQTASMRNGSGDEYAIVFRGDCAYLRGFDHESALSPFATNPPVLQLKVDETVPKGALETCVNEPAFSDEDTPLLTVLAWNENGGGWFYAAPTATDGEAGGADWLFDVVLGGTDAYIAYAEAYFDVTLDRAAVDAVFAHSPLTSALIQRLNKEPSFATLDEDIEQIAYAVEG